ncbi:hypothetical protein [Halalkalibacter krulwichiae]|uniref:Lipoprotein n=1 Tax=Halalkalibacter krulwichiae TaxID=199441 RepID=A0A1X9MF78_9BACI|nr:hypothetical protein [Halalkalibacter krulwichiae]ARK30763.1 hypothetical protein BkAM31D_13480 [Halalkalibacter krulwichiae]
MSKRSILIVIVFLMLLSACGVSAGEKPTDVRGEIWTVSSESYRALEDFISGESEFPSEEAQQQFQELYVKYLGSDDLTEKEVAILENLADIFIMINTYKESSVNNYQIEEIFLSIENKREELEKIFN